MRVFVVGLALALSIPAAAQAAPDPVMVGAWRVSEVGDSCQATAQFGDHVGVSISEDPTGNGAFVFGDDRWGLKDGDPKPATISWDGWKTSSEIEFTAVQASEASWLLVAATDSSFTENLAGSKHIWLRVPGVDFDDDFDIPNAGDVLNAIVACNEKH
jgi:hypothetical protein